MTPVSSPTFRPLYKQIKELLLDGLRGGEWRRIGSILLCQGMGGVVAGEAVDHLKMFP